MSATSKNPYATAYIDADSTDQDELMHNLMQQTQLIKAVALVNPDHRVMAVFYDSVSEKAAKRSLKRACKRNRNLKDIGWITNGFPEKTQSPYSLSKLTLGR